MSKETYLGDGLYASDDGFQIKLRAPRENGDHVVYLEPEVVHEFMRFLEKARGLKITAEKLKLLDCGCQEDSDDRCEKCCDHGDVCEDERVCLICDADMTEHFAARAEAAADARSDR
jgi:hypothetical protein